MNITAPPSPNDARQLKALQRFAIAITILNILGHTVLGFEQSWLQPLVALAAAYASELILECVAYGRNVRFLGKRSDSPGTRLRTLVTFLLPAHISGLAVAMLLYANERTAVIAFAAVIAITSKAVFCVPVQGRVRHFLNPSNFGITVTLLLFPWVGVVPPYHFTENVPTTLFWLLPLAIICTGSLVNYKLTRRHWLILGWLGGFVLQAWLRTYRGDSLVERTSLGAALAPMSGVAFILFTFYMISDPKTTPERPWAQICFGASVALVYGLVVLARGVFAMFFALTVVCALRGAYHLMLHFAARFTRSTIIVSPSEPATPQVRS